MKMQSIEM